MFPLTCGTILRATDGRPYGILSYIAGEGSSLSLFGIYALLPVGRGQAPAVLLKRADIEIRPCKHKTTFVG